MGQSPFRFLVTAGSTREKIDRVRDWGNIFTGRTGLGIARALCSLGDVDLLTSNESHLAEVAAAPMANDAKGRIQGRRFASHSDLRDSLEHAMTTQKYGGVFMTAAVSDYSPARTFRVTDRKPGADGTETWTVADAQAGKVKSHYDEIAVLGKRTEKLVDLFRTRWGFTGLLVKFKLEVGVSREELIRIGEASRAASGADFLVANTLDMVDGADAGAYLISPGAAVWVPRATLAGTLQRLASSRLSAIV